MTINLEKALIKANKKILTDKELLIVREYEKNAGIVDDDALLRVGLNRNIKGGQLLTRDRQKAKDETLKFKQERVFHISQIEKICKDYYVRFLPSVHYVGSIDKDLPFKINNFEAAYGVQCKCDHIPRHVGFTTFYTTTNPTTGMPELHYTAETTESYIQNTFIMAPASSFKLAQRPKDPLFFYKINEEYYYLIHKWGNDLSLFRRVLGFWSNSFNCWLTISIPSAIAIVVCFLGDVTKLDLGLAIFNAIFLIYNTVTYLSDQDRFTIFRNKWDSQYIETKVMKLNNQS